MAPHNGTPPATLCLLRLSALGDVCNQVPLIRAIQAAWPKTRLTWIVGKLEHRLVGDLAGVEFITLDKRSGLRGITGMRARLAERYDVLVHSQLSVRSNLLALAVRARRRIGWDKARSREGHSLVINERIRPVAGQHQVQGFLEFARHLGVPAQEPVWDLPVPAEAHAFAEREMPAGAVVISPCSSHPCRNWHVAGYARIADWIIANTGRPVVLTGGPTDIEHETGAAIAAAMRHTPVNLIGRDTLKQALALFRRAAAVIAPDSGPAHFAAAMGTPVVGLYAATWSKRSGPYGSLHHCVDRFAEAARGFRKAEPETLRWGTRIEQPGVMDLITEDDVIARLEPLLKSLR